MCKPQALEQYLDANRERYDACIDSVDHDLTIDGVSAELRLKYIRFDADGEPKFKDLAECLADHLVGYAFSCQRRSAAKTEDERARLHRDARRLLRKSETSGEAGEILLYFLLEAVLQAPQLVAKLDLKTSPKMELHGSDGIHAKWHEDDEVLDVFFGEAKLEQKASSAITNAFSSISSFHEDGLKEHEIGLVTSHYKWVDDKTKEVILQIVDRQKPGSDCRTNHACLIGFDWAKYKLLNTAKRDQFINNFEVEYLKRAKGIQKLFNDRFSDFPQRRLRFVLFCLPFQSVQEFRDAFIEVI